MSKKKTNDDAEALIELAQIGCAVMAERIGQEWPRLTRADKAQLQPLVVELLEKYFPSKKARRGRRR